MPSCTAEPFVLFAEDAVCAESPLCTHVFCFRHINCLLASTLAPIIAGCRLDDEDVFCVCPTVHLPLLRRLFEMDNTSTFATNTTTTVADDGDSVGLSSPSKGAVAGIVIGCIVGALLLAVLGFFLFRYLRDRRKNHGEYRPQFEEQHHAKDLPYLQPPNIEGLI